jgi:FMN phosphatase YigB (HAD superfamily)
LIIDFNKQQGRCEPALYQYILRILILLGNIMITHLLVDLDDTLLQNSMEIFAPPYYKALTAHLAEFVAPEVMLPKLLEGTNAMLKNADPHITLEHAFDKIFYPGVGVSKEKLHPSLVQFYNTVFPDLKKYTQQIPSAIAMVNQALKNGLKIVVATNPLFPLMAIRQRLIWSGLSPEEISYTLIACYEDFHFTKPNPAYYQEIITKLDIKAAECVMVGNDIEMDILPALSMGIHCFRIGNNEKSKILKDNFTSGMHQQVIPWINNLNSMPGTGII